MGLLASVSAIPRDLRAESLSGTSRAVRCTVGGYLSSMI
jgi:hypothetical protein